MKKNTDTLLKKIVRQSLNENYSLLNEAAIICPAGGFCIGTDYEGIVNSTKNNGTYVEKLKNIGDLCNKVKMGKPTINDSLISSFADKLFELLGKGGVYTEVDENKVKGQLNQIKNFRNFCAVKKIFKEKTNFSLTNDYPGGLRSVNSYPFSKDSNSANEDTQTYVLSPLLNAINVSLSITENQKKTNVKEKSKQSEKWQSELKKSGWATRDEWEKAGWKSKPKLYSVGGGGNNANQVSFQGYDCILEHPALIKTPKEIPQGVGYKLDTGNKTIDSFIFGVQKQGTGDNAIDQGVIMKDDGSGIVINFNCPNKYLQHSLSTNVWNYDAVMENGGKIALTTDPDYEDDGLSNNSIQNENIKGFRYNLLTEAEFKVGDKGPEVGKIQKKLGLKPDRGTPIYGSVTKVAVEKFQKDNGLPVTGNIDSATYSKIIEKYPDPIQQSGTGYTQDLKIGMTGADVVNIQTRLGVSTKGGYGVKTETAVKNFQKKYKLSETGVVDKVTYDKIMSVKPAGTAATYSGKKHNYKKGNTYWIKVTPETEDPQLSGNDGYFKITEVPNEYTVVIEAVFVASGTTGGSTQRVLFGEDAKQGTQQVIKSDGNDNSGTGNQNSDGNQDTGRKSGTVGNVDPEKQRQRDIRNKEMCDTLRQVKQYLNNTKDAGLDVNCKRTQKTINQIMMALTGGSPVIPTEQPVTSTPGGNVTVY